MTNPTDEEIAEVARKLTKAQREALEGAEWRGSGLTQFAVVSCLSNLPASLAHMFSLRWDKLTPLGLRVKAYLQSKGDEA